MTNTQQKEKPNFLYYTDWAEQLLSFPADLRLKIDDAVKRYVLYGEEPTDRDVLYSMFGLMRAQIDRDRAKYADVCNKNSENANKRWKNERMRSHTNGCNRMRSNAVDADNDNDNDNENDNDLKETSLSRSKEKEEDFGKDVDKPLTELREELLSNQTWIETLSMNNHIDENESRLYIEAYIRKLQNEGIARKSVSDAQQHFARWLIIELKRARDDQSGIHQKPNSKTKQERYAEFAEAIAAKLAAGDTSSLQDGGESALPF